MVVNTAGCQLPPCKFKKSSLLLFNIKLCRVQFNSISLLRIILAAVRYYEMHLACSTSWMHFTHIENYTPDKGKVTSNIYPRTQHSRSLTFNPLLPFPSLLISFPHFHYTCARLYASFYFRYSSSIIIHTSVLNCRNMKERQRLEQSNFDITLLTMSDWSNGFVLLFQEHYQNEPVGIPCVVTI